MVFRLNRVKTVQMSIKVGSISIGPYSRHESLLGHVSEAFGLEIIILEHKGEVWSYGRLWVSGKVDFRNLAQGSLVAQVATVDRHF